MKLLISKVTIVLLSCVFGVASVCRAQCDPDTQWTYKTVNGKELRMDVFLPEDYASGKAFPVFVVFHGGSWQAGEPNWHYPDCEYWRSRGMIAASVEYRLKTRDQVEVPLACVQDAKSAVRFLRANAEDLKVNPDKIVVAGGSAGGQMAAAVAMIDGANDDSYDLSISCVPNAVILYNPYFRCQAELSPPNFIKSGLPPFITFLGDQDPAIKVEDLNTFHEDLLGAGNASEYYVGKDGKHGLCNGRNPMNPYFYWSLELEDRFLVKHGLLTGASKVKRPDGVKPVIEVDIKLASAPKVKASAQFVRLDVDHSGFLSMDEYVEQFLDAAMRRDADKDGQLTVKEFPFSVAFSSADADQDGLLNRDEIRALYTRQFHMMDLNNEGVVTADEMLAFRKDR
jgi:acetyl esterase/lipase